MALTPLVLMLACTPPEPIDLRVVSRDGTTDVWIRDGKIVPVQGREPTVRSTMYAERVTPGFIDAHAHPEGPGNLLAEANLEGQTSRSGTLAAARLAEARLAPGAWLVGRGWDQNDWTDNPGGQFPTAAELDAVVPARPAALKRVDGHALWLNSAAMKLANIDASTPDPPGGRVLRDGHGAPTGVLLDAAMDLVKVPRPPPEEQLRRLREGLALLPKSGLVGVHAMGIDDETLAALRSLDEAGELRVRIWAYLTPESQAAADFFARGPSRGRRLELVGVKAFADGALGSRGALLSADYADDPGNRGLELTGVDALASLAERLAAVGGSLAVHAIGDRGVKNALDAFGRVGPRPIPWRVEHAQVVDPTDLPRFKALNVVASMQPTHATSDAPWAEARLGPERVGWSYAWRTVLNAGIPLAFGSDFPVEAISPSFGLWSATTRRPMGSPAGSPAGWRMEEALTLEEATDAFTRGPYAALGRPAPGLEPGAEADLTLWDRETRDGAPFWVPLATIIGGEVVFEPPRGN